MNQSTTPLNAHANVPFSFETRSIREITNAAAAAISAGDLAGLQAVLRQLETDPDGKEKAEAFGKRLSQLMGSQIVGFVNDEGEIQLAFQEPNYFGPLFAGF